MPNKIGHAAIMTKDKAVTTVFYLNAIEKKRDIYYDVVPFPTSGEYGIQVVKYGKVIGMIERIW